MNCVTDLLILYSSPQQSIKIELFSEFKIIYSSPNNCLS